jgi:hypothetical protein
MIDFIGFKKMKSIVYITAIILVFVSCNKTEVRGRVYSKHGFPISNGTIILNEKHNAASPRESGNDQTVTYTDNNGYFFFKFRWKFTKAYKVRCESDSGKAIGPQLTSKKSNDIILD